VEAEVEGDSLDDDDALDDAESDCRKVGGGVKDFREDFVEDGLFFEETEERSDGSGLSLSLSDSCADVDGSGLSLALPDSSALALALPDPVLEGGVGVIDGVLVPVSVPVFEILAVMLGVNGIPPGLGLVETDGLIIWKTPTTPGPKKEVPGTMRFSSAATAAMALTNSD